MIAKRYLFIIFRLLIILGVSGCAGTGPPPTLSSPAATITRPSPPSLSATKTPSSTAPPRPTSTATLVSVLSPSPQPTETPTPSPGVLSLFRSKLQAGFPHVAGSSCDIENVVIISIDGLRPDALEQAETPTLDLLRDNGAYTPQAQAVLPSVTLVNHASMLGGMSPEKHGIYWNSNDADLGKIKGPTLFSVAHAEGLRTAMVVGKPKLEDLVLPASVDQYIYAGYTDGQVRDQVLDLLQAGLPHLLFIHLPDVDSAGHATGWMSLGQLLTITRTDGVIGQIVAALEAGDHFGHTLLIITSDHGGQGKKHGGDTPENRTIPWLALGPGVPAGVLLQTEVVIYDTAATALYALGLPIPEAWDGRPAPEIFDRTGCQ